MTIPAYFNIGVACTDAHLDTPVADRAVVGEQVGPDKTVVAAYMLPAPSQSVGAGAIMAYAGLHLASHKCPRIIHVVADLPRTANGKVLRRARRSIS